MKSLMRVLGGILMFFAPQEAWAGWVLLGAGIVIEALGIAFEHKRDQGSR